MLFSVVLTESVDLAGLMVDAMVLEVEVIHQVS